MYETLEHKNFLLIIFFLPIDILFNWLIAAAVIKKKKKKKSKLRMADRWSTRGSAAAIGGSEARRVENPHGGMYVHTSTAM